MGQKRDLLETEKQKIVQLLRESFSSKEIAQKLNRDHRTVKKFLENIHKQRRRRDKGKFRKVLPRQQVLLKRAVAQNPLTTSQKIFSEAGIPGISRSTRWRVLESIAKVKSSTARPPLTPRHKVNRVVWAARYMKLNFSNVIFTDECRATLDGPDGFARGWILDGLDVPSRLRRQQGGGGVMFWAGLYGNTVVGPFRVPDGVKMNSVGYTTFLSTHFLPWYRSLPAMKKRAFVFMQDNAPSHASRHSKQFLMHHGFHNEKYMDWPSSSPDLNPLENYWAILKSRLYSGGRQFSTKNELWKAILETFAQMDADLAGTLTNSVDRRLVDVLVRKGGYIFH
jgi:hypothetical protein